jgi:RNA polymerase sigma-70 factor, ECF subfamily
MRDPAEFLKLFLQHEADLRAVIGSLVRDWNAAEDVLQETALTTWERFDEYDRDRSFGAWARGIAVFKVLRKREQTARSPILFSPEAMTAVLDAFDRSSGKPAAIMNDLGECLEKLPEKARQLLSLRYGEALDVRQVAERTAGTTEAVYKALLRARKWLRECLENRRTTAEARQA